MSCKNNLWAACLAFPSPLEEKSPFALAIRAMITKRD